MKKLIISAAPIEKRAAVLNDDVLIDIEIVRPSEKVQVGDIFYGFIQKIDRKMEAAFVDLGNNSKGFIHLKDIPESYDKTQGAKIPVQIVREGSATKLPLLTGVLEFSGDLLIYLYGKEYISVSKRIVDKNTLKQKVETLLVENEALIIRSNAENATKEQMQEALTQAREKHQALLKEAAKRKKPGLLLSAASGIFTCAKQFIQRYTPTEIITDDFEFAKTLENTYPDKQVTLKKSADLFADMGIKAQMDRLARPVVHLANGSSLFIEKTEAMWVVDVNSGRFKGTTAKEKTVESVNLKAVPEILRQIRLRNMSGMILVDFIGGMSDAGHRELYEALEAETREEYITTQVAALSQSGLLQLTRRKKQQSFLEVTTMPCPVCYATGHVASKETLAFELERELAGIMQSEPNSIQIITTEDVLDTFLDLNIFNNAPIDWEVADERVPFYQIARVEN
ncbi:ribonuclease E/G [Listeria swaminathanii]|uniref:Ribonuclease E/G n=1 Tax=Listeria swaminathanii TaxID=2713501 RepID=A0ABU2ID33_9LIST|nr:ribonuclease E/G [Listeria swaminathanii]MDT0016826.1 ribonuclease E/G [Listeria swaminathanii]MDT0022262.1 ribonuclease E/G [Listeria swaminathanii]MDT0033226.1 ribonuclease E/G [Listeria swaminathanii]MDT0050924.1 ribonuclease E/G [Listeria swaminathanii]MDT0053689.1 ribonuclease E/G [Listeria swaminathanii]